MRTCPRCGATLSFEGRCRGCGGSFLGGDAARGLLVERLGIGVDVLREMASQAPQSRLACVACAAATKLVVVKGVQIDACTSCGGVWLDAGEHARIVGAKLPVPVGAGTGGASLPGRATPPARESLAAWLGDAPVVHVKQHREWSEMLFGFETANRYLITAGVAVGSAIEHTDGILGVLRRLFLLTHRPFDIEVRDPREQPVMNLHRPFFVWFSSMRVDDVDGAVLGCVERRFALASTIYDVLDAGGTLVARVKKPWWRVWRFPVVDARGREIAVVEKRWGGWFREALTDADKYAVTFLDASLSPLVRGLLVAAALNIDLDAFEGNQQRRRGLLRE